jgi:hypothetical protein
MFKVDDGAVSQDVHCFFAENTGRDQIQRKFTVFVDNGMTGVAAPLIAYDNVVPVGKQVNHPTLSLISPVDSDNSTIGHFALPFRTALQAFHFQQTRLYMITRLKSTWLGAFLISADYPHRFYSRTVCRLRVCSDDESGCFSRLHACVHTPVFV